MVYTAVTYRYHLILNLHSQCPWNTVKETKTIVSWPLVSNWALYKNIYFIPHRITSSIFIHLLKKDSTSIFVMSTDHMFNAFKILHCQSWIIIKHKFCHDRLNKSHCIKNIKESHLVAINLRWRICSVVNSSFLSTATLPFFIFLIPFLISTVILTIKPGKNNIKVLVILQYNSTRHHCRAGWYIDIFLINDIDWGNSVYIDIQ